MAAHPHPGARPPDKLRSALAYALFVGLFVIPLLLHVIARLLLE